MKNYTLYKRGTDGKPLPADAAGWRERPWHFRFKFRGQPYTRCLDTADADAAQKIARKKADAIRAAVISGELDRLEDTKTRHAAPVVEPTLGELYAAYLTCPVVAKEKTRKHNARAMTNLLTRLHPELNAEKLLQTPFPKLVNGDTAEAWFKLPGIEPQTANSLWRQAASLCAPRARFTYHKLRIDRECLAEFGKVGRVCQRPVSKAPPRPPSDDIIARTLSAWETSEERNLFLAVGHMLAFGLRIGEIEQAKENWWTVKYGVPMLCATGDFKNNHGYFELPALDPWFSLMRTKALTRGWLSTTPTNDYLITGSMSYRTDGLERDVSTWLRGLGWETTKTNHALRAYAGSQVCLKFGVYKAKEFLRHSSVKVTEQHYMYLLRHPLIDSIRESCAAKWATLEPTLTVVAPPTLTVLVNEA
jgi:integrase